MKVYRVFHTANKEENHFSVRANGIKEAKDLAYEWVVNNTKGYTFFNIWKWQTSTNNYEFVDYSVYVNQAGKIKEENNG